MGCGGEGITLALEMFYCDVALKCGSNITNREHFIYNIKVYDFITL